MFEEDVSQFIASLLEHNERICYDYHSAGISSSYMNLVSLFLPNGCRRLSYPEMTAIEIQTRITSGTVEMAIQEATNLQKEGINKYILISQNIPFGLALKDRITIDISFSIVDFLSLRSNIIRNKRVLFGTDDNLETRRDHLLQKAFTQFSKGPNTFILGAGVSQDAGVPGWEELLEIMRKDLLLNKDISVNESNAILQDASPSALVIARYLKYYSSGDNQKLVDSIHKAIYSCQLKSSQELEAIGDAIETGKITEAITYNYDDLLERVLQSKGISTCSIDRSNRPYPGCFPILHVHGFIPETRINSLYDSNVVLSEDDYHTLYRDAFHWANIEQMHALMQTTCFFIGLSLKDPSVRRLLDISFSHGSGDPVHFAFLNRNEYEEHRQAEYIFHSMGINIIWFTSFDELPLLIRNIAGLVGSPQ